MPWPDIFYKAKKRPESSTPPPLPTPPPEAPKIVNPPSGPAPTKPPPSGQSPRPQVEPLTAAAIKAASQRAEGTRTLPVMHGVVLRPLTQSGAKLTFPAPAPEPIKNIEQLMAEADPVKTLSQTGSVRMLKRLSPEAPALRPPGTPPPIRAENLGAAPTPAADSAVIAPPKATEAGSPWPSFAAKDIPPAVEAKKTEQIPVIAFKKPETQVTPVSTPTAAPAPVPISSAPTLSQPRLVATESTFLTRPVLTTPPANRPPPPALPPMISIGSIARRKAKLADVARIVLPPKREETGPLPQPPTSSPSGTPATEPSPASIVAPSTGRLPIRILPRVSLGQASPTPVSDSPFMERAAAKATPDLPATAPVEEKMEAKPAEVKLPEPEVAKAPEPVAAPVIESKPEASAPVEAPKTEPVVPAIVPPAFEFVPKTDYEAPKLDPSLVFDPATMPAPTPEPVTATTPPSFESVPQVDPEAHKPAPAEAEVLPKLDPEAHKAPPPIEAKVELGEPVTSTEIEPINAPGTREFHLTNGERIAGIVLSETPDAIYVEHPSLGVLTVPRDEIATRLAEIILINGDRIVGNIMAETADMLYVRHSSLGMLSVPKAQRSRRVVEAILKNGDRILGEVLTETDTFTVIKSATLGTVTVPHNKIHMLNRKIEQIEMKALPSGSRPA